MSINIYKIPTTSGTLYYGPLPNKKTLEKLNELGVDIIWNLASELSLIVPYEEKFAKTVLFANIVDYSAPSNDAFLKQLYYVAGALKNGKRVFVHCFGGHGRTGTALAAIKVLMEKMDPEDALDTAFRYAKGPESEDQEDYIRYLSDLFRGD